MLKEFDFDKFEGGSFLMFWYFNKMRRNVPNDVMIFLEFKTKKGKCEESYHTKYPTIMFHFRTITKFKLIYWYKMY